jgi:DNA processing protein
VRIAAAADVAREAEAAAKAGARLVAAIEPDYPEALAAIEDAPPILSIKGDTNLLSRPVLGIVGARNASLNGKRIAKQLALDLGKQDFLIASGLARGIDTAAHGGALETGTVAVLAGGIDVCYPAENQGLYDDIAARGVLIAELPVGTEPQGRHFPRRNRIISGLSRGVILVEAAPRSGSLITARFALEQGREVFAVPGSPLDPRCRGTNNLIRDGAVLTEEAEDVLRALASPFRAADARRFAEPAGDLFGHTPPPSAPCPPGDSDVDRARAAVLECLSPTPAAVDELIRECQVSPAVIAAVLLELELAGRLERHPGQRVSLIAVAD